MKAILLAYILTASPQLTPEQQEQCLLIGKLSHDIQMARQESHDDEYLMTHKIMLDLPDGEFKELVRKVLIGVFHYFPDESTSAIEIHEMIIDGCVNSEMRANSTRVEA